jgi:hypothetical protein
MLALGVDENNCIICGLFRSWFAAWGDANLCCNSKVAFYFAYAYVWRVLSADDIELKVCVLECRNQRAITVQWNRYIAEMRCICEGRFKTRFSDVLFLLSLEIQ